MYRPSPSPLYLREEIPRLNFWKITPHRSAAMPMPWSRTASRARPSRWPTETSIGLPGPYLIAFDKQIRHHLLDSPVIPGPRHRCWGVEHQLAGRIVQVAWQAADDVARHLAQLEVFGLETERARIKARATSSSSAHQRVQAPALPLGALKDLAHVARDQVMNRAQALHPEQEGGGRGVELVRRDLGGTRPASAAPTAPPAATGRAPPRRACARCSRGSSTPARRLPRPSVAAASSARTPARPAAR